MYLSAESSVDDSGSEDMEKSADVRDKPRDLEAHFRIRFNASGLATEGGPIGECPHSKSVLAA